MPVASGSIRREHLTGLDVVAQARGLLGVEVHTRIDGVRTSARIVETEAYRGADDKASHAYGRRRTNRTEVFFGPPGHAYVYLCYGIHLLFNVIVGPVDEPNAVLVRAVAPLVGTEVMLTRRGLERVQRRLTGGPGLVTQALAIGRGHNGVDLFDPASPVRLAGAFDSLAGGQVEASARVGVAYAEECAAWRWRFRESGSAFTSPARA